MTIDPPDYYGLPADSKQQLRVFAEMYPNFIHGPTYELGGKDGVTLNGGYSNDAVPEFDWLLFVDDFWSDRSLRIAIVSGNMLAMRKTAEELYNKFGRGYRKEVK